MSSEEPARGASDEPVRKSRFRFKSRKRRRSNEECDQSHSSSQHRSQKDKRPKYNEDPKDDPTAYDDTNNHNARSVNYTDPDSAFRESLFDAMADDEGAAFWQGVYGQPIHVYPNQKEGPQGELERMTDEEYAEYVRTKMWEKTHQHVVEERQKREERRRRRRERREEEEEDWERAEKEKKEFERKVRESLRKGEERRDKKRWQDGWKRYTEGWSRFQTAVAALCEEAEAFNPMAARIVIPWPVESGRWRDVAKGEVERFLHNAIPNQEELGKTLKAERVRWHPDKMQQRFGANKLDDETMKTVTAVFQVIDQLWVDVGKAKR